MSIKHSNVLERLLKMTILDSLFARYEPRDRALIVRFDVPVAAHVEMEVLEAQWGLKQDFSSNVYG